MGEIGRLVALLVKLYLLNIPVMILREIILTLLYFLSQTTAVAEAHNVISQLHFRLTLIVSHMKCWRMPQENAFSCLAGFRYLSTKYLFSDMLKLSGINK